ncbi:ABC transporter ATP-binding protein [Desulfobaculum bizertense]|uniref:Putative ABC transport system ATP-binding protein n=1 Tax=Desulfobaculum bizertense DSM 18034 TaxID=1121442 RepID=A0A1T4W8A5_9BACT|nr:ATP-binding cassette domain-containing protein [Desulfobaculum bizertense]UIJ39148.1 ATP-binding cassette domain-containing protein [Desulfobaculum bizertense]SKA73268.1 putative ABC transport system ATP-binding protein [Desulfobaculum bizertense DSM 18034]
MLRLEDICLSFHKGSVNEVQALNSLNLTIHEGDFITVIGSNGAGKSTLLNTLAGTYFPDSGSIVLMENDITRWPEYRRARHMGRVFQDPLMGTCASMTIAQNLALARRRSSKRSFRPGVTAADKAYFRKEVHKIGLGLEDRLNDRIGLLSGGQRQALTLLMATMVRPDILLLDEHTAALDPKTANSVLKLTEFLVEDLKLTTLMVTHNMNQAIKMGNRLIMLHQGEVILDVSGEAKQALTVNELLARFYAVKGEDFSSDRMLLS